MTPTVISFADGEKHLDWIELTEALIAGHQYPKAEICDSFLYRGKDTLLTRSAFIDGLGAAVKSTTVFPGNPAQGKPTIHGMMTLYADNDGAPEALVDFDLVTAWKTAGDSLLGARLLARPGSRHVLIIGAGRVARNLCTAYRAAFPEADFSVWNRTPRRAEQMAEELGITPVFDLEHAVRNADIVTSATMSTSPFIQGAWLAPGTHLDLVGAFRPDMREADSAALQMARVFVDSFDSILGMIGEINTPLTADEITRDHLLASYYEMDRFARLSDDEITVFKNGGGAHLDLMTARYILEKWQAAQ